MAEIIDNVILMLNRRGYNECTTDQILPANKYNINFKTIASKINGDTSESSSLEVYYVYTTKVSIDVIKYIINAGKSSRIIIVYEKSLTPDAKQAISVNKILTFEIFSFEEMSYDPIIIVPHHYIVPAEECKTLKETNKFPIILETDIISRYYHFRKGMIIGIEEAGNVLVYKRCV